RYRCDMRTIALPSPLVTLMILITTACYVGLDGATEGSTSAGSVTGTTAEELTASASHGSSGSSGEASTGETSRGPDSDSGVSATASSTVTTGDATTGDVTTGDATTGDATMGDATTGDATTEDPTTTGSSSSGGSGDDTTGSDSGGGDDNSTPEGVCTRWNYDLSTTTPGSWTGAVAGCDAGDYIGGGKASTLTLVNLYRWLADLPPVTLHAEHSAMAQECALMMHANGNLSHTPPMNWKCYTADGAAAAGKSNIATTAGVPSVGLYMLDPGNATTIGHRRWILSNSLGSVGVGSTSGYSCMWVIGGGGQGMNQWTAWPAPGPFPLAAAVDSTGWTVQSDAINLSGAAVKVTADGIDKPMKVTSLLANYGSASAISMIPQGWSSEAGKTYKVELTNVDPLITYEVEFVDCD
ncbi:MAG: CAP domain-containing protein, partial [Nannocystaceae bacterium]